VSVVILAPNWLGDAMFALPAIRDVRRHFAGRPLTIAARASIAPVFRAVPGVDHIKVLQPGREASQIEAEIGILLPNSFRSAWILKRAGVRQRWGYRSDFRSVLLTKAVRRPRGKVSYPEYYSNLVRGLGIETGPLHAGLELSASTRAAALKFLHDRGWTGDRPLVGIAPGAAFGHAKRWLPARFAELAASLTSEGRATCVILGRSDDRDAARHIDGLDLIGATDLTMLMGVIAHCQVVVANDSGALHLAGALGVRAVGIYGPTDERYSAPMTPSDGLNTVDLLSERVFCRPCFLADCPIDHRCMKRIPTERVYGAVRRFLHEEIRA
jgi:lipopolysaccharide heptosyltransferase II